MKSYPNVTVNFTFRGICPRGKRMLPPETFKKERDRMLELEENARLLNYSGSTKFINVIITNPNYKIESLYYTNSTIKKQLFHI